MDDDADARAPDDGIGQRRGVVTLFQEVFCKATRAGGEYGYDGGVKPMGGLHRHGVGIVERKDALGDVLEGDRKRFPCVTR